MKKRALRKDFHVEIKKSLNRFLSIFFIVALGVAFFSGIQSSAPDMRATGDMYFDESNLMDIRVISTLGLTEQDLAAIADTEGVGQAVGCYMEDVFCGEEDAREVLHVESIPEGINLLAASEGSLPEKSGECFLDASYAQSQGYRVGDTLVISVSDEDDSTIRFREFTVAGIGYSPCYISFGRGSTALGNGSVSGFIYLPEEDFDSEAYGVIYATVEGAKEAPAFSDAYDELVETVCDRIGEITDGRCEIRYAEVVEEAQQTIEDAKQEVEDGQQKVEDAKQELADGEAEAESELAEAESELIDGEEQFREGKRELTDAKEQIADAQRQIDEGFEELASGIQELADGKAQIAGARATLEKGEAEYQSGLARYNSEAASATGQLEAAQKKIDEGTKQVEQGWKDYNAGLAGIESGEAQLAEAEAELTENQAAYDEGYAQYVEGKTQYEAAEANLPALQEGYETAQSTAEQLEATVAQLQDQEKAAQEQVNQLTNKVTELQEQLSDAQSDFDSAEAEVKSLSDQIGSLESELESLTDEDENVDELKAQIEDFRNQLETANSQLSTCDGKVKGIEAALQEYQGPLAEAQAGLSQIQAGLEEAGTGLASAQSTAEQLLGQINQINAAKETLDQTEAQLAQAARQLAEGRAQTEAAKTELDAGRTELAQAKTTLEATQKQLEEGQQEIDDGYAALAAGKSELDAARRELDDGWAQLNASLAKLETGEQEIADARQELEDARKELADGRKEVAEGEEELKESRREIIDGWAEYEEGRQEAEDEIAEGRREIEDAEQELADAQEKIEDGEKELAELKYPEWYVYDRSSLPENTSFGENADRLSNIAKVIPILFFVVAALISLTTMTRMVEEERTQIGTLKALGYSRTSIASKYIKYALFATLGGSVFGVLFGEKVFPWVIINAYGIMFQYLPGIVIPYNLTYALIASGLALVCTLGATLSACFRELQAVPAELMRPPSPKEGKRVLLEYIPILWGNLSFSWKSTVRNLMRYKKRFLMTVIGIGGCMGLLLVGYGLRDSIMDVAVLQFENLQTYDAMVILDTDKSEEEQQKVLDTVQEDSRVTASMRFFAKQQEVQTEGITKKAWDLYVYVPENVEEFGQFFDLRDRVSKEEYELTDEGAVLTEKIANELGIKAGETITLKQDEGGNIEVPVLAICENYLYHYLYLTPSLYEELYGEAPEYNCIFWSSGEEEAVIEKIGEDILSQDAALNITYTGTMEERLDNMLGALDIVIVVIIISAGMLAFVVLYNLNNININERRRELATLKVLGFYDMEVAAYVYRENVILTLIGAVLGIFIGKFLHMYVITTVEVEACMFGRNINLSSFIIGTLFTVGFSVIVNLAMYFKLKKIDMVESLKSIE